MDISTKKKLCYCEIRSLSEKSFNGTKTMFKINFKINIVLVLILIIGLIEISEGKYFFIF